MNFSDFSLIKRPFTWIAVSFGSGIAVGAFLHSDTGWALAFSLAALLGIYVTKRIDRSVATNVLIILLLFLAGVVSIRLRIDSLLDNTLYRLCVTQPKAELKVEGVILNAPVISERTSGSRYTLLVTRVRLDDQKFALREKSRLFMNGGRGLFNVGDRIRLSCTPHTHIALRNPGASVFAQLLRSEGVPAFLKVRERDTVEILSKNECALWRRLLHTARVKTFEVLKQSVSGSYLGLCTAVLLGDRGGITLELREDLINTGTMHMLAVSGLHVTVFFLAVSLTMSCVPIRPNVRSLVALMAVITYVVISGARPPAVRAGLMVGVMVVGDVFNRRHDSLNALCVAAFIITALNPLLLFSASFQMSFTAVASLLLLSPHIELSLERLPYWLRKCLAPVLAIVAGLWPLSVFYFGKFSLAGLLLNLVIPFMLSACLYTGVLSLGAGFVLAPLAKLLGGACGLSVRGILNVISLFSGFSWSVINVAPPSTPTILFYFLALILAVKIRQLPAGRQRGLVGVISFALIIAAACTTHRLSGPGKLEISVLDVGHGDSVIVRTPHGNAFVIDGGVRNDQFDAGSAVTIPTLRRLGIRRLAYAFVTHMHLDHAGGMSSILDAVPHDVFVESGLWHNQPGYDQLQTVVAESGAEIFIAKRGDAFELDGVQIQVLSPPEGVQRDPNEDSLVLKISYGEFAYLHTGDIEKRAEKELVDSGIDLTATVMHVPHHGSRSSSTKKFIRAVNPAVAIVSSSPSEMNKGAAKGPRQRYAEAGIELFQTAFDGAVIVLASKSHYETKSRSEITREAVLKLLNRRDFSLFSAFAKS
ncbi:DNA internalization-related competence protein ComEC/Rec2 [Candidatus Hydrogenedentota bacterium]